MENEMLTIDSPKVKEFLAAWTENFNELYIKAKGFKLNPTDTKHTKDGQKYIKLNMGSSGHFMVDKTTHIVYSIKGYGVPNKKKSRGTIEFLTEFIKAETAAGREYTFRYWYDSHPTE